MKKIIGLFLIGIMIACSSDDSSGGGGEEPDPVNFDRSAMLTNWADNIIMPAYTDFLSKLDELETATNDFNAQPDANTLEALRSSWLTAYTTWQKVSMFEIGPAESASLRLNVNIYPADADRIESNINNGSYDFGLSSNRVAKGFPALDYLLYGLEGNDSDLITRYSGDQGNAHKQYLTDVVADMITLTTQVKEAWETGYRDTFVANDGASATASTDRYVNDFIFYYEKFLRAGKMGIPAGVFSGTVVPENIEAPYRGDISKQLFLTGLDAVRDFFNGRNYNTGAAGESLKSYLDELNVVSDGADLGTLINTQLNTARSSVQNLNNFAIELQSDPPTNFLTAYDEVQRSVPLLKVDMVSAMSITIDFVDADGD